MNQFSDLPADADQAAPLPGLPYDAVLLAGFGGPEGPDDVLPFLRNVTRGRGIPDERLTEVSQHYLALGGISPINGQNQALQAALSAELESRGLPIPVLWGNRNWAPFLPEVVTAAHAAGHTRLLGLATSAYSSYSSCRQYREDFGLALQSTGLVGQVRIDKIRPYFDQPGFLEPFATATTTAVKQALGSGLSDDEIEIVFTTHSIPTTMADTSGSTELDEHGQGGAYVAQHLSACRAVMADVGEQLGRDLAWQLAFQSRSGPPTMPWLEPDIREVISSLPSRGRAAVIVVPIGFVSDHVEVIWDLDREARDVAGDIGLQFWRVATPGTDERFVRALADLVAERLGCGLPHEPLAELPARPDSCAVQCCANLRGRVPTTAGDDSATDWAGTDVRPELLAASGICQP